VLKPRRGAVLFGALLVATFSMLLVAGGVEAKPDDPNWGNRRKSDDNPSWSDPTVRGIVQQTFWADGKDPKSKTATIVIWSAEADLSVTIYGDNPIVRAAILDGTACVGRYIEATGVRLDANALSAQGIVVPNLDMECTATLQ
jgi:hypothetical protein